MEQICELRVFVISTIYYTFLDCEVHAYIRSNDKSIRQTVGVKGVAHPFRVLGTMPIVGSKGQVLYWWPIDYAISH